MREWLRQVWTMLWWKPSGIDQARRVFEKALRSPEKSPEGVKPESRKLK